MKPKGNINFFKLFVFLFTSAKGARQTILSITTKRPAEIISKCTIVKWLGPNYSAVAIFGTRNIISASNVPAKTYYSCST